VATLVAAATLPGFAQVDFLFPHGFAAGDPTADGVVLWTHRDSPLEISAQVFADPGLTVPVFSATVTPGGEHGGFTTVAVRGLRPATRYFYRFLAGGIVPSQTASFLTAPAAEAPADLRLVFSGDADGTRVNGLPAYAFDLFDTMAAERPDLFLFIGDTMYADSPRARRPARTLAEYRAKYLESRSAPALQRLLAVVPTVAIWDDHEVQNDFDRETVDPDRFAAGYRAFTEAWPMVEQPGGRLYRTLRWGRDVELFILDLRSHRTRQLSKTSLCANPPGSRTPDVAPTLPSSLRSAFAVAARTLSLPVPPGCLEALRDPRRTLLGPAQKAWLMDRLLRSDATWKFIVSSVPVQEFGALPYDRWEGYAAERGEILSFIQRNHIRNIVWFSADTHAVLVNEIRSGTFTPAPEGTGMTEVVAGPIATASFGQEMAEVLGPVAPVAFAAFAVTPPPRGPGMSCVVIDRFTYALVEVSAGRRTVTITPKDEDTRPVCRTPLILTAAP